MYVICIVFNEWKIYLLLIKPVINAAVYRLLFVLLISIYKINDNKSVKSVDAFFYIHILNIGL